MWWEFFLLFYSFLISIYLWYRYGLVFSSRPKKYPLTRKKVSVIVPVYNEEPGNLYKCIVSIMMARGEKEIIIVNDGSTKKETVRCINFFRHYALILHQKNKGKRHAQALGIRNSKHDIIVTIDSDTIVGKDSILELIKPLQDPEVGGVTGNVKLANKNQNLLTRAINSMYWTSFNIDRRGTSGYGFMPVCSGALAAYRKRLLLKLMPEYLTQNFLGSQCSVGDDRFITLNIQKKFGYEIKYQGRAVAYTYSPHTLRKFLRQLVRWKQSVIRETFLFRQGIFRNKLLFLDVWYNFIMSILSLVIRLHLLYLIIFEPLFLINFSIVLVLLSGVFSVYMLFYNRKEFIYRIFYAILNETVLWISFPIALINLHKQGKWGTR